MYYIWLFLVALRDFSTPFRIPSILLTIIINILIFIDFIFVLAKNNFRITKIILILIPYSIFVIYNYDFLMFINVLLCCYLLVDKRIENIILYNAVTLLFLFFILFAGITLGYISDDIYISADGYKAGKSLWGFGNPNTASGMFFQLVVLLYYLGCRYKIIFFHLLCLTISVIVFKYTGGRTYFYSEILLLISGVFFYNHKFFEKTRRLFVFVPILAVVYLLILVFFLEDYNKYFWLDAFLSGRLYYYQKYFSEFTILNLFIGKPVPEDVVIDSFYIGIYCITGVTSAVIFYFLFSKFVKNKNIKKGYIFSIVLSLLFSGFFESTFLGLTSVGLPLFWLLFYKSAYSQKVIM